MSLMMNLTSMKNAVYSYPLLVEVPEETERVSTNKPTPSGLLFEIVVSTRSLNVAYLL